MLPIKVTRRAAAQFDLITQQPAIGARATNFSSRGIRRIHLSRVYYRSPETNYHEDTKKRRNTKRRVFASLWSSLFKPATLPIKPPAVLLRIELYTASLSRL
jgi:hypothetical protein